MHRRSVVSLWFVCLALLSVAASELKLVVLVHRHGDRGPIAPLPTMDPVQFAQDFPLGPGELTGIGMSQLYQLGTNLRAKYVGPAATFPNFLSPHWNHTEHSVRCTDVHRSLQSAESLLYAMFPPGTGPNNTNTNAPAIPGAFQPIPISNVPLLTDDLLLGYNYAQTNCPTYQKFMANVEQSPAYSQKAQESKSLFDSLTNITGFKNTMQNAVASFDYFTCYKAHNLLQLRFPGVTQDLFDQLTDLIRFELAEFATNASINCLASGPLVQEILSYMQQTVNADTITNTKARVTSRNQQPRGMTPLTTLTQSDVQQFLKNDKLSDRDASGPPPLKFLHYSAHDTTVFPLLAALLGEYPFGEPPYAAHVIIELHQSAVNDYFVRVFYNDTQLLLPYCHGLMDCAFADLQAYLTPCGKPKIMDDPLCGIPPTPSVNTLLQQIAVLQTQVSDLKSDQDSSDSKAKNLTYAVGCLSALVVVLGALLFFFFLRKRGADRTTGSSDSYRALGAGPVVDL